MNSKYLQTASDLLRKDQTKLRSFQRATDQFRASEIGADAFLTVLSSLFGRAELTAVVDPLIEGLPEKDKAKELKSVFAKKYQVASPVAPAKATPAVTVTKPTVAAVPVKPAASSVFGGTSVKPLSIGSISVSPVSSKVPAGKKIFVDTQVKALVVGSITADSFYSSLVREVGKVRAKEIIPEILSQLPRDKSAKLQAVSAADK